VPDDGAVPKGLIATNLRELAAAAAKIATYCDQVEHTEQADVSTVAAAAATTRVVAITVAKALGTNIFAAYAARLDEVEQRFVLGRVDGFRGGDQIRLAETWRDLQLIQGNHDTLFRPDVNGLARNDQLRHCCLHLTKLLGRFAHADEDLAEFTARWLPDTLLIGVKLSTVIGEVLPEEPLPEGSRAEIYESGESPSFT
jgi:hypothetical protein